MISSISLRLLPKTCGLFDTGFAGGAQQITSTVPSAPGDVLSEFGLEGHDASFTDPSFVSTYENLADTFGKADNQLESLTTTVDEDNWDLLGDLSADPLGDESLDAFINLDKYLTGNSFFDEDGQFVQEPEEVAPVINLPVIDDLTQSLVTEPQNSVEMVQQDTFRPVTVLASVADMSVAAGKPSRKRKRKTNCDAVKTSLFEIPESAHTDATVANVSMAVRNELDHDYSSKRPKLTVKAIPNTQVANITDTQSTTITLETASTTLDKQSLRRMKNNVASKRSREQRKQKFVDMDIEAEELVVKNDALREKIAELEKLTKEMKAALISKMAGK